MRNIIFFLLFLLPLLAFSQTDNTINKGSGVLYFSGKPNFDPSGFADYSEIAIDVNTKKVYIYSGSGSLWNEYAAIDTLSTLADTATANNPGRIAHIMDIDQKWTVNSAGSWEVLSASNINTSLFLFAADFGAKGDGLTDDTDAIQSALDSAGSAGGGTVILPRGTVIVSNVESEHPEAMLVVPKNVHLRGYGRDATILTRAAANRSNNGIFIVNKNYDEIGNYGADGNIIISHFTITDGATTPNRGLGDLIGIGNSDGVLIENMKFGNHDQHAVDISSSRNVVIRNCYADNDVTVSDQCATFQVETALGSGIWGIFLNNIPSQNILIENNVIYSENAEEVINIMHGLTTSTQEFKNIKVKNNYINFAGNVGHSAIGGDEPQQYSIDDFEVSGNRIVSRSTSGVYAINFWNTDNDASIRNMYVYNNYTEGSFASVLRIGANTCEGIRIENNNFQINNLVAVAGVVQLNSANDVWLSGNTITHSFSSSSAGSSLLQITNSFEKSVSVRGNIEGLKATGNGQASETVVSAADSLDVIFDTDKLLINQEAVNFEKQAGLSFLYNAGQFSRRTLNFSNAAYSKYNMTVHSVAANSDTITFPNNALTFSGDSLKSREITADFNTDFFYLDSNFYFLDTFGVLVDIPSPSPPSPGFLLDSHTGSIGAYSLKNLSTIWSDADSAVVRLRRKSDNTEQDFSALQIENETNVTSFCSATDCSIVTIYDQSGNAYDITQSDTSKQPLLVQSGAILKKDGEPAILFDGSDDALAIVNNPFTASAGSAFVLFSFEKTNATNREIVFGLQDNVGAAYDYVLARFESGAPGGVDDKLGFYIEGNFEESSGTTVTNTNRNLVSTFYENNVTRSLFLNGVLYQAYSNTGLGALDDGTDFFIGSQIAGTNYFNGYLQELVLFDSNKTTERADIESNIQTKWNYTP